MTVTINGTTGIDKVQDGSIVAADLASGVALSNIGTGGITSDYLASSAQPNSFKNRIINGAMMIDQRNAGASVTITTGDYTLDRWNCNVSQASKISIQQNAGSVTPPTGFSKYLGVTSLSAYSVGSGDYFFLRQYIEGFNFADMGFGTANASTVTLSFKVYSSLTGTFGGTLKNSDASRSYPFSYTVSSANTWTTVSVTIPGDTSGTWIGATNGVGAAVLFNLGTGSTYLGTAGSWASANYIGATGDTSVVGTNGATFYITGVQLEKGSTATSFDYRPYGTELALCQRYANSTFPSGTSWGTQKGRSGDLEFISSGTSSRIFVNNTFQVVMRASPTVTYYNPINNNTNFYNWSNSSDASAAATFGNTSDRSQMIASSSNAPVTDQVYGIHASFSAEL